MKIPHPLPQFEDTPALLIIAGRQAADLHSAHKGTLKKLVSLKVPNPAHSDREEFFASSSRGIRLGSGSVYESKEDTAQHRFLRRLEASVSVAMRGRSGAKKIYLFAPETHAAAIRNALPGPAARILEATYFGNYVKLEPLEALERMFEERSSRSARAKRSLAPERARKILDKSRQARRVVGK